MIENYGSYYQTLHSTNESLSRAYDLSDSADHFYSYVSNISLTSRTFESGFIEEASFMCWR